MHTLFILCLSRSLSQGRSIDAEEHSLLKALGCECQKENAAARLPQSLAATGRSATDSPGPVPQPGGPQALDWEKGPSLCYVSTSEVARAASPTQKERMNNPEQPGDSDPLQDKSIGLVQRFKKMLKQYGKVMIPVHLVTSSLWFGAFYYTAMKGVNVVPFLEYIGLPDKLVDLMEKSQSGYAITAYAMYKIATPARYTVTLAGTSLSVKYLRKHGYMSTPPPVKEYIQDKMEETRERFSEKMEETKGRISGKMEETKDRLSGRMEETKDKFSEKLQQTKDKVSFRKKDQGP